MLVEGRCLVRAQLLFNFMKAQKVLSPTSSAPSQQAPRAKLICASPLQKYEEPMSITISDPSTTHNYESKIHRNAAYLTFLLYRKIESNFESPSTGGRSFPSANFAPSSRLELRRRSLTLGLTPGHPVISGFVFEIFSISEFPLGRVFRKVGPLLIRPAPQRQTLTSDTSE